MTIDELKAAYAAGATIQIRVAPVGWLGEGWEGWMTLERPFFDASASEYRIKPTGDK